jgi:hypothetical protein
LEYRAHAGSPGGSGTAQVGGQNISFTYQGTGGSIDSYCERCGDRNPERRWRRWRRLGWLTNFGVVMLVLQLLFVNFAIIGSPVSRKGPSLIEGLGHGSALFLSILVAWFLAAWTRSFKWLAVPLLAGLIALALRFISIAPQHRIPMPAPEFLLAYGTWTVVAVLLVTCVTRKPFA